MELLELWAASQNLNEKNQLLSLISQSQNQLVSVSQNLSISSLIIILYAIVLRVNKKGCFIAAFILCEVYANNIQLPTGYGYRIFLGYAFIYSLPFWLLTIDKAQLKTRLACGIMVLFEARMCIDDIFNSDVETYIYANYEYITLFIHLYLITTLLPWSRIRRSLGKFTRALYGISGISDGAAYLWYNREQT